MAKSSKGKDQTALNKKATAVAAQRGNKKKKRGSMKEYFKGVKLEMKKVVWPTWPETVKMYSAVLVFVLIMIAIVSLLDYAFGWGLLKLFGS